MKLLMTFVMAASTAAKPVEPLPLTPDPMPQEEEWEHVPTCPEMAEQVRKVRGLGMPGRYNSLMSLMENACPKEFEELEEEERQGNGRTLQG